MTDKIEIKEDIFENEEVEDDTEDRVFVPHDIENDYWIYRSKTN
jgi:hypothetical protein